MSASADDIVKVARHRTAMVRHALSQPISLLVRHGLVREGTSVFDYGCGQGDDLRALVAAGVNACGWDPHFAPEVPRVPADVVNLGFVLNVIEDSTERTEALRSAWLLTQRVLAVSTMIVGQVPTAGLRPFRDGYLTTRGTFQKYFQHAELRTLLRVTLEVEPVAAAPGIFFAFRHAEDEEDFLLSRRSQHHASINAYKAERQRQALPRRPGPLERIQDVVEEIACFALRRGRLPHPEELAPGFAGMLAREHVSFARAVEICRTELLDKDQFASAVKKRQEDLLVHYALRLINRSRPLLQPRPALVRDVRALFGSQRKLAESATEYLYALADPAKVAGAMIAAANAGCGILDERGRLVTDGGSIDDLPGILRCYLGCAIHLSGEPEGDFLARLDPERRIVTLFPLENRKMPLPLIFLAIGVDLKRQDVTIRADPCRLLRKADLLRLGPRAKQRKEEATYRQSKGIGPAAVFEKL